MKEDKNILRSYINMVSAGISDLIESIIICLIVFALFAAIGIVKNAELYIRIICEVAWAVSSTSFGIRVCEVVNKKIFTILMHILVIANVFVTAISIVISIIVLS